MGTKKSNRAVYGKCLQKGKFNIRLIEKINL